MAGPSHTFLFADLAGFTALTEAHGDEEAADLAAEFFRSVRAVLPEHQGDEVKSIGDALLLRFDDADQAVELGLRVVHEIAARHGFPIVRVGMHSGTAVERDGDWFGGAVNIAARVSGLAAGGEVLLTEATRAELGDSSAFELRERGRHQLRNVREAVDIYAAVRTGQRTAEGLEIDPVCRMAVERDARLGMLVHGGREYSFCSQACVEAFVAEPERFVAASDD